MMDFKLDGQVAIVTGASRGLGRAMVIALVEQGMNVIAVARSMNELEQLQATAPNQIKAIQCDMMDKQAVAALPDFAVEKFGRLDVLINNAGIAPAGSFLNQDQDVWDQVIAVNVTAPAILSRAALLHMTKRGSGKIINIASTSGILGKAMLVAYSSSKGALVQFTKALAAEVAKLGIQVNAIAPGAFETDAQNAVLESPDMLKRRLGKIPARRMGACEEIGPLVCYLSSELSNFATGGIFVLDGGESSKL
ncbi:MAG: SDR family oxidoreductase [Emcibacter sp.]|nr:SDR family oxidoreductase [Emcibacter sp.]